MTILSNNIAEQLVCKFCHGRVTLIEVKRQGLDSELVFHCSSRRCDQQLSFHTSEQISVGNLSVCSMNRRSDLAMRTTGCDRAELSLFCGVMDLPQPVQKSSYNIINSTTEKTACSVQQQSMTDAAAAEFSLSTPIKDTELRNIDASSGALLCQFVCVCVLFKKQCFFLFLFLIIIIPCYTVSYARQ